jgi:hypothetical protein
VGNAGAGFELEVPVRLSGIDDPALAFWQHQGQGLVSSPGQGQRDFASPDFDPERRTG